MSKIHVYCNFIYYTLSWKKIESLKFLEKIYTNFRYMYFFLYNWHVIHSYTDLYVLPYCICWYLEENIFALLSLNSLYERDTWIELDPPIWRTRFLCMKFYYIYYISCNPIFLGIHERENEGADPAVFRIYYSVWEDSATRRLIFCLPLDSARL